jgi:hypothetical protein
MISRALQRKRSKFKRHNQAETSADPPDDRKQFVRHEPLKTLASKMQAKAKMTNAASLSPQSHAGSNVNETLAAS